MKYDTISEIRSWPLVDGWFVEPVTGRKIRIGDEVELGDWVELGDGVVLGDGVELGYGVELGDEVRIDDWGRLGNEVELGDGVRIGARVRLGDRVELGDGVRLGEGEKWMKSPLHIRGSKHLVYEYTGGIAIGCMRFTLDHWLEHFETIGAENGYSASEIVEYKNYLDFFKALGKGN